MQTPVIIFFSASGITVLGWIAGHALNLRRERESRRRPFRGKIQVLLAKLADTDGGDLCALHRDTKDAVRDGCAELLTDIRWHWRGRFSHAARCYCGLGDLAIENPNAEHLVKYTFTEERPNTRLFDWELGRKRMQKYLGDLVKYAQ